LVGGWWEERVDEGNVVGGACWGRERIGGRNV
jgi:hypothetical protein